MSEPVFVDRIRVITVRLNESLHEQAKFAAREISCKKNIDYSLNRFCVEAIEEKLGLRPIDFFPETGGP